MKSLKWLVLGVTISELLFPRHAGAEVRTFDLDDRHLYLNESRDRPATYSILVGWEAQPVNSLVQDKAPAVFRGTSALDGDVFVSRGAIRLSRDRFLDLVERSEVDSAFVSNYRGLFGPPNVSLLLFSSIGLSAGLVTIALEALDKDPISRFVFLMLGYSVSVAGLGGIGMFVAQVIGRPPFDWDETYQVILAYNAKVDKNRK